MTENNEASFDVKKSFRFHMKEITTFFNKSKKKELQGVINDGK
jgi:phage FluMu protein Com